MSKPLSEAEREEKENTRNSVTASSDHITGLPTLLRACLDLGAAQTGGPLSPTESQLLAGVENLAATSPKTLAKLRSEIRRLDDPLGKAFCAIRDGERRRRDGAFYTDFKMVEPMVDWVLQHKVDRVVDPGCGSGRFSIAVLNHQPTIHALAIDLDPIATIMTRAAAAALKLKNLQVLQCNYMTFRLPQIAGKTGFVGNPPYVRHHDLSVPAKMRAAALARALGHKFSQLAGLHTHFFLATAANAKKGDVGALVTSAEWLDVGYGSVMRALMLNGLGGKGIHVVQPEASPFDDAMSTAAIAYFEAGSQSNRVRVSFAKTARLFRLGAAGKFVPRDLLVSSRRWTPIVRGNYAQSARENCSQLRRLGHLFKVSRGQVTGANGFFVMTRDRARELGIQDYCVPAITAAEDILGAPGIIRDSHDLKVLFDPARDVFRNTTPALESFLEIGERHVLPGAAKPVAQRYVCSHRKEWWRVRAPRPPIVVTYMARQAPKFAVNVDGLALLNVAHGLYPRVPLSEEQLNRVVVALNHHRESFRGHGRTYHGGLEKFEPGEVEALPLPAELQDLLQQLPL